MTVPRNEGGSGMAGAVAIIAALAGVALLVWATVRVIDLLGEDSPGAAATTTTVVPTATTSAIGTTAPVATAAAGAVTVTDDSGLVSMAVPGTWTDVSGSGWAVEGNQVGPAITAAVDIDEWYAGWGTPGVFLGVTEGGFTPELGDFSGVCALGPSDDRVSGALSGVVQTWSACGQAGSDFHVFLGGPGEGSYSVLVQLVATDGAGRAELERILATFSYQG